MNKIDFNGRCTNFLEYDEINVYKEEKGGISKYLFYISRIKKRSISLKPVNTKDEKFHNLIERTRIYENKLLVMAVYKETTIHLYASEALKDKLKNTKKISLVAQEDVNIAVNKCFILHFDDTFFLATQQCYQNFLQVALVAAQNRQNRFQCTIL